MSNSNDVEEIRRRADLVDVIGTYVTLKRAGNVYKGLCPFHNEKTPSFQVNPDRGLWYCFGQCSEGGDVFKFVQKIENLTFRETLERLASRVGYVLTDTRPSAAEAPGQKDRWYRALDLAAKFYEDTLKVSDLATGYLERRQVGFEAQKAFRIGYAGEDSDAIFRFLSRNGVTSDDAVACGIVIATDYGAFRDKLWGRVVFPIFDANDRPIAFGGRLMESIEGRPKYLNSAETALFHKGRTLYGLSKARKAIAATGEAIVVEGYMDVVACHQAGFENAIATLGTALTDDHAGMLKRYAKRVLLAFDADAAGMKAAAKANAIFKNVDIETRMLDMPEGEDPDSILRAGQRAQLEKAISSALPVTEFHLRKLIQRTDLSSLTDDERLGLFRREALPLIKATGSVMERERYMRIVAPLHPHFVDGNAMAEDRIREEIDGPAQQLTGRPFQPRGDWKPGGKQENRDRFPRRFEQPRQSDPVIPPPQAVVTAEMVILKALLSGLGEPTEVILSDLQEEDLLTPGYWAFVDLIRAGHKPTDALRHLENVNREVYDSIIRIAAGETDGMSTMKGETIPLEAQAIRDCIRELRDRRLDVYERALREKVKLGDVDAQRELPEFIRRRKGSRAA